MQQVLITGGAGYIGSHTVKRLAGSGYQPVILDNLSTGHRWALKWGKFVEGELSDSDLLSRVFREYGIDSVIHFAAHAYVGESMKRPEKYFENNVANTLTLLRAMLDRGVKRIVFSSSCTVYGNPASLPITEEHPQAPANPYGDSKLFIEKALRWYGEAHGLKSVILRYFNAAGADPEGELGELHDPETHLIPLVMNAARGGSDIEIFGTDYPTPDGTAVRDYVHVSDLADAHVQALEYLNGNHGCSHFNLGTGNGYSVRQVIETVKRVSGCPIRSREKERRPGDPPALVASAEKARRILKWEPRFAELDSIVETAWAWHCRREETGALKSR